MSTIVPVEALARRDERFACTPLRASMTAEACLLRRARVTESGAQVFPFCARCELGAQVEARVGAAERTTVDAGHLNYLRAKANWRTRSAQGKRASAAYRRQRAELAADQPPCAVPGCPWLRHVPTRPWANEVEVRDLCKRHRKTLADAVRRGDAARDARARVLSREFTPKPIIFRPAVVTEDREVST